MTRQNYTQYQEGDRVLVSDGQKRPPDRFNRKLAAWKSNNYTGHVKTVNEARDYEPYGSLVLKRDDYPDGAHGAISFQFHVPLGGYLTIDKLKEAA
jgi:hypothetical protein